MLGLPQCTSHTHTRALVLNHSHLFCPKCYLFYLQSTCHPVIQTVHVLIRQIALHSNCSMRQTSAGDIFKGANQNTISTKRPGYIIPIASTTFWQGYHCLKPCEFCIKKKSVGSESLQARHHPKVEDHRGWVHRVWADASPNLLPLSLPPTVPNVEGRGASQPAR